MADVLTTQQRSYNMSRIKSKDTKPELVYLLFCINLLRPLTQIKNKMSLTVSMPCTLEVKELYIQAITNTRVFIAMVNKATDPAVKQYWIRAGLMDGNYADNPLKIIIDTKVGERLRFTHNELIQLTTAMDICCKFYLSPMFQKVEKFMMEDSEEVTPEHMNKGYTYILDSFQSMIAERKKVMKGNAKFKIAISKISKLEITEFESDMF